MNALHPRAVISALFKLSAARRPTLRRDVAGPIGLLVVTRHARTPPSIDRHFRAIRKIAGIPLIAQAASARAPGSSISLCAVFVLPQRLHDGEMSIWLIRMTRRLPHENFS